MYIKRSYDKEEIGVVLQHALSIASQEDGDGVRVIPMHDLIHYVLVYSDKDEVVGCYTLLPHNDVTVDIHVDYIPKGYGEISRGAIPLMADYIFKTVGWKKAIAEVPSCNPLVHRYVRQTGMKHEGTLSQSFLKDNTLYDIIVYGMTEEEYKCHQNLRKT